MSGKITPEQVAIEFQNAIAVLHPVIWEEPFGRIAIEAMTNGAVLIPSDIGAIREIVGDSYKLHYPNDSFEELSKNIERALTDSKLCQNLTTYL